MACVSSPVFSSAFLPPTLMQRGPKCRSSFGAFPVCLRQLGVERPVLDRHERQDLPLALDHDPQRRRSGPGQPTGRA